MEEEIKKVNPQFIRKTRQQIDRENIRMIKDGLRNGVMTKSELSKFVGIGLAAINRLFDKNKELYHEFLIAQKLVGTRAADGIINAVIDPSNKSHYNACRYIADKYKTDLDDSMEKQGESDDSMSVTGVRTAKKLVIEVKK